MLQQSRTSVYGDPQRTTVLALSIGVMIGGALPGCRAPGEPVDAWPPEPPENGSVLDRTTYVPGQPEQRAPTAPAGPEQPLARPEPAEPREPQREPAPRTPSPHPAGVPERNPDEGQPQEPPREEPREETTEPEVQPAEAADPVEVEKPDGMRELFPNVRVDLAAQVIEFDGIVPIDAHDPETPRVYLEVTVCTPDSKEHETLVMTEARPSHVHAALLAMGLTPGNPGGFKWENGEMTTIAPAGDPVIVTFIYADEDGRTREIPATKWIINAETGEPFAPELERQKEKAEREDDAEATNDEENADEKRGFVFAGSVMRERMGREMYDADGIGTLIGLTTFGAETIAWREVISPDSHIHTPVWIANPETIPPFGTEVTVRIRPGPRGE